MSSSQHPAGTATGGISSPTCSTAGPTSITASISTYSSGYGLPLSPYSPTVTSPPMHTTHPRRSCLKHPTCISANASLSRSDFPSGYGAYQSSVSLSIPISPSAYSFPSSCNATSTTQPTLSSYPSRPTSLQIPPETHTHTHHHLHVHFPPTPTIAQTFPTYSKRKYDRTPLAISPNECALPERGAPGRTWVDGGWKKEEVDCGEADERWGRPSDTERTANEDGNGNEDGASDMLSAMDSVHLRCDFLPYAPVWDSTCSFSQTPNSIKESSKLPPHNSYDRNRRRERGREERRGRGRWKLEGLRGVSPLAGSGGREASVMNNDEGCFGGF